MAAKTPDELTEVIATSAAMAVPDGVSALTGKLKQQYGDAALAILAYGSCLRGVSLDDSLADLYILVSSYRAAHGSWLSATANRLLPPNVYYLEQNVDGRTLRAKYAVVSLDQFERKVSPETSNPYFWARFAQPCALVYVKDEDTSLRVHRALASATQTAYGHARSLSALDSDWKTAWTTLLTATYGTELRPEDASRAALIVSQNAEHFERISKTLGNVGAPAPSRGWGGRRIAGKFLSVLRLIKAGFTFQGGADYVAWKVSRHSGVTVEVTPWQRRHPILGVLAMAPKLYRKGGFK